MRLVLSKSFAVGCWLLAAALLPAAPGAARAQEAASVSAPGRIAPQAGTGAIHGSVRVLERRLFGGLRPAGSSDGVLVSVRGFTAEPPAEVAELHQRDETFVPRILPVVVGQRVRFPNDDEIYHNVFSVAPTARFDLGHYKGSDPPGEVLMERTGIVPVYCNIHPDMIAYVVVLENAAFAFSDADGRFAIEGVPPGRHELEAWMPGATPVRLAVEVRAGEAAEAALEIARIRKIPPHRRKDGSHYPPPEEGYDAPPEAP